MKKLIKSSADTYEEAETVGGAKIIDTQNVSQSKVGYLCNKYIMGNMTEDELFDKLLDKVGEDKADNLVKKWKPNVIKQNIFQSVDNAVGEAGNITIEMIKKLFSKGLGEYVHIKNIGPFGRGEATLEAIEGEEYGNNGYAHGYVGYEEDGYDSEDEALDAYLENNTVYVFSKDIGQSGCNWLDEDSMYNYLDDVYIDEVELKYANSEAKKVFKELGILGSKEQSRTLIYTVKVQIDTYEGWEDDYSSFDKYVDDVASDAESVFHEIPVFRDGVTVKVTKQSE